MFSFWILWLVFLLVFVLPPIGYGWGYRGWGPPYPRYVQRRREQAMVSAPEGPTPANHQTWGWRGDAIWMMLMVWVFWAGLALWWR